MKIYSHYGFNDFVVCLGYKGYVIKEYFANYFLHMSDVTFDMRDNSMVVHQNAAEPWRVTLVDTGADTQTGGRIKRVARLHRRARRSCSPTATASRTWTLRHLLDFHREHGKLATVTAVQPLGRFGASRSTRVEAASRPCWASRRSRRATAPGSTAGYFVARAGGTGPHRRRRDGVRGRAAREPGRGWPAAGLPRTTGSGSRWTPCATSGRSKRCGIRDGTVGDMDQGPGPLMTGAVETGPACPVCGGRIRGAALRAALRRVLGRQHQQRL